MSSRALSTPQKAPSTPAAQSTGTPSTPNTGTWQHPRMAEIVRRQNKSTFTDRNLRSAIINAVALFGSYLLERFGRSKFPSVFSKFGPTESYPGGIYFAIQFVLFINILMAISPLLKPKDTLSDIPLTPAQRSLLGLPPTNTPPTPGSTYATPPRYTRSPATRSVSGTPLQSSPLGGSPLNGRGSPLGASYSGTPSKETGRASPFSPNQVSPLLHKTFSNTRRDSYGSGSPSQSIFGRMGDAPGTPSPSGGSKASVPLNNKWLYDKGRTSQGVGSRVF